MFVYRQDHISIKNIHSYKYKCIDKSLCSRYILKYYWSFLTLFIPRWLAPNVISLLGLITMFISGIITLLFNPELNYKGKSVLHLFNAILLFVYSTFDALDGKQAVRTNSSSPLGQMFDHGVDSLVTTIVSITLASSLGLGINYNIILILSLIYFGFYLVTIHEKYTDNFILGYLNGPTEGVLIVVALHLLAYFYTPAFFDYFHNNTFINALSNITVLLMLFIILYLFYFFIDLLLTIGYKSKILFKNLLFIVLKLYSLYNVINYFNNNILYCYLGIFTCMFIFSYMNIELIFSRIKNTETPLPPCSYYLFIIYSYSFSILCDNSKKVGLMICFIHSFVVYFIKVFSISYVVSDELKIRVFKINEGKKNK